MKKLTKLAATALAGVALFIGTTANAQTTPKSKLRFGIGLEAGAPTGDAHYSSNFELGGTARLQYGVGDRFALMLTSGYYNFFGKDYTMTLPNGSTIAVDGKSYGLVPVKAGMKAFFTDNLYFSAEAGAGFETSGAKNTKLILSPGLGWANQKWDVGVRYEDFSGQSNNYGIVGLRLAYGFEL